MKTTLLTLSSFAMAANGFGFIEDEAGGKISEVPCSTPVEIAILVTDTWCRDTHPDDFNPEVGIDGPFPPSAGAHTSPTVAIAHDSGFAFFGEGTISTAGECTIATTGSPADAQVEWNANPSVAHHTAGAPIPSCGSQTAIDSDQVAATQVISVLMDEEHTLLSFGHMLAPSPDFVTFATGIEMCVEGYWRTEAVIQTKPYDAGCDSGTAFIGDDVATDPQEAIREFVDGEGFFASPDGGGVFETASFYLTVGQGME